MNERNQMSQSTQNSQAGQSGNPSNMPYDPSAQGRQVSLSEPASRTEPVTTILPPVDIYEDDAGFTVIADMPGVSKDRLGVRVTGDSLVIDGTALVPVTGSVELLYGEIHNPQYRRSFTLSRELDPGKIEAKLNNGVLRLRIPKAEEAKPRRITVQVG
ncbi:MAG TPA: Hsp20/alpha crystallin family protein [Polaromonas sp.]|jgi:HSP20 family molecular chaperone IbpA